MNLFRRSFAEFLGTFVLVFIACGVAIVTNASVAATSLAFGLVIVAMAYSIGNISGCHINPAVSIAMLISKKMTVKEFFAYVAAQLLGALAGAGILYAILMGAGFDLGDTAIWATNYIPATTNGILVALLLETFLTFVFVYVIICITNQKATAKKAGFIIGLTLTLVHLLGINITGTSVNPARSLGTAVMAAIFGGGTTALAEVWVFIVAPLLGGIIAVLVYKCLNKMYIEVENKV